VLQRESPRDDAERLIIQSGGVKSEGKRMLSAWRHYDQMW
jgi:hypothetical protein